MNEGPIIKHSVWANMPPELLRDVILRIEASEIEWPPRKHVIACAGVCRSWRKITEEMVQTPESSGRLTFPISLKQPGPRDTMVQCYIRRDRASHSYRLYLGLTQTLAENGKFLLAARRVRRPTSTDYIISLDAGDISKGSGTYIGKLRSNFLGTKFTVYDAQLPHAGAIVTKSRSSQLIGLKQVSPRVPAGNYTVAHISYELNALGARGPRKMHCVMDAIPATAIEPGCSAPTQMEFLLGGLDSVTSYPFLQSKSTPLDASVSGLLLRRNSSTDGMLILRSKAPRWHEQLQCWCLNFCGRVTVASVKNFQLVAAPENAQMTPKRDRVGFSFSLGKWPRIHSQWILDILCLPFRLLLFASAALIPRLLVSEKVLMGSFLDGLCKLCS